MKKIHWVKMVSRRHSMFRADFLDRGTALMVKKRWDIDYDNQMFFSSPKLNAWFCGKKEIAGFGDFILAKVEKDNKFASRIAAATEKSGCNLVTMAKKAALSDLKQLSDKQLARRLEKFAKAHYDYCAYFDVSNSIREIGTQKVKEGLAELLKIEGRVKSLNDYLEFLLKPSRNPLTNQEQIDLRKVSADDAKALAAHTKKYEWLSIYNPDDQPLPFLYFKERRDDLPMLKSQNQQLEGLAVSEKLENLIGLMKKYVFLHTFRAEMLSKSYYSLRPLLLEIGRRWKIDLKSVCALTVQEINGSLADGRRPDMEEITKREKAYLHLIKNGKTVIYSGKAAREFFAKEIGKNKKKAKTAKIRGTTAYKGFIYGYARVIKNSGDLNLIKDREIIVATMTSPDYVGAIRKSGAVVTDEGGLLCHAAIICRELQKPCIVGTKIATATIKNGDWLAVDADDAVVEIKNELIK